MNIPAIGPQAPLIEVQKTSPAPAAETPAAPPEAAPGPRL